MGKLLGVCSVVALILASCGDDDGTDTAESTSSPPQEQTTSAPDVDPCALLEPAEIAAVLNASFLGPSPTEVAGLVGCRWDAEGDLAGSAYLTFRGIDPEQCTAELAENFGADPAYSRVDGLANAYITTASTAEGLVDFVALYVCTAVDALEVDVGPGMDQIPDEAGLRSAAIELARTAIARLPAFGRLR